MFSQEINQCVVTDDTSNKIIKMELISISDWLIVKRNRLQDLVIMKTNFKLTVIWIIFVIGSFSHDYFPLPQCYFSRKKNIFNVFFVKIGWGWTFMLVSGYIITLLMKHRIDSKITYVKHIGRLLVETVFWFVCTSIFEIIESFSGYCIDKSELSKNACRNNGLLWSGFDISGHSFLLVFCILIINKELNRAKKFSTINNNQMTNNQAHIEMEIICVFGLEVKEKVIDVVIELFSIALIMLMLLWEVMLFFTCAYFHNLIQKLVGLIVGVGSYYLCYKIIFNQDGLLLLRNTGNVKDNTQ